MKSNFIKYIFIVFVIILIVFSIFKINKDESKNNNSVNNGENNDQRNISTDLRLAIVNYDTINPILSNNGHVQNISRLVFEPLVNLDKDYKPIPCLATEWNRSGDSSYVIKLREDVKWQDGSKFTSKDVKFTIDILKSIPSLYSNNVQHIIGLDIVDDYALKITLDNKDANIAYKLTFPILSNNFYIEQDFQTTEKNNVPMGTGMYKITSNEGGTITLKKNQNWWNLGNVDSKIEEIRVIQYASMGDAYNAFKMGNLDVLSTKNEELEKYVGTIGYNKAEYKGREFDFIAMNCSNEFLSDKNVRNAICYAIDRDNIIATVFGGNYYGADYPLDFNMWLYNNDNPSSGYNPERTKEILQSSGWEYTYGYWQKKENYKTLKLSFTLTVSNDNQQRKQVAEIIKQNLEAIGIPIKISYVSDDNYKSALSSKNYEIILAGTYIGLSPDLTTYFGDNNVANYQNDEVKNILSDLTSINEEDKIKEKYNKLYEYYKNDTPYKSLYFNKETIIYSSNLKGEITPNLYSIYYNIENWYREF